MPRKNQREKVDLSTIRNRLYIGVDIGKKNHTAGFMSRELLKKHVSYERCPTLVFENTRDGFNTFVSMLTNIMSLDMCHVVIEITGHYGKSLEQFLLEKGLRVYRLHPQKREGLAKTDKRDSLMLANHLYNQLELEVQVADKRKIARPVYAPIKSIGALSALVLRRETLVTEGTRLRNKLIAIGDELFPEQTVIFNNVNLKTALAYRKKFPTPEKIAQATMEELRETRTHNFPSNKGLEKLQALARSSIGVTDEARRDNLALLQGHLIDILILVEEQKEIVEQRIREIMSELREAPILLSIPGIGLMQAAGVLVAIGNINNFPTTSALRSYCGFAARTAQSGSTLNSTTPDRTGNRMAKRLLLFAAFQVIKEKNSEFFKLYQRMLKKRCVLNPKTGEYDARMKAVVPVAQHLLSVIYVLLKNDQSLLAANPDATPPPRLYDVELHRQHRAGNYRPFRSRVEGEH